jgi:hypothetical protein
MLMSYLSCRECLQGEVLTSIDGREQANRRRGGDEVRDRKGDGFGKGNGIVANAPRYDKGVAEKNG